VSINPFDDAMADFSSSSMTRSNADCGRLSPMFSPAGGWYTAKRIARAKSLRERLAQDQAFDTYPATWLNRLNPDAVLIVGPLA
jgi:hypothetical protein